MNILRKEQDRPFRVRRVKNLSRWDDDYEESERGQFDQACCEILDGWQFDKFGDLPTRKQVAKTWELVKSQKSNKTELPTHVELVAALIELFLKEKENRSPSL